MRLVTPLINITIHCFTLLFELIYQQSFQLSKRDKMNIAKYTEHCVNGKVVGCLNRALLYKSITDMLLTINYFYYNKRFYKNSYNNIYKPILFFLDLSRKLCLACCYGVFCVFFVIWKSLIFFVELCGNFLF